MEAIAFYNLLYSLTRAHTHILSLTHSHSLSLSLSLSLSRSLSLSLSLSVSLPALMSPENYALAPQKSACSSLLWLPLLGSGSITKTPFSLCSSSVGFIRTNRVRSLTISNKSKLWKWFMSEHQQDVSLTHLPPTRRHVTAAAAGRSLFLF